MRGKSKSYSTERLEMDDLTDNGSLPGLTRVPGGSGRSGCYVSLPVACLLVLLALAVAAGVGVVTYFASHRPVTCECRTPNPPNVEKQWQECQKLAAENKFCLDLPHCQKNISSTMTTRDVPTTMTTPGITTTMMATDITTEAPAKKKKVPTATLR